MRVTRLLMGMPITVEIVGTADPAPADAVFQYFVEVDSRFSTYREDSEISAMNRGAIPAAGCSEEMREVLAIADRTRRQTKGYFDIRRPDGALDPSGIVKGWAIRNAARLVSRSGARNFFIDAGGDIQAFGRNLAGRDWSVGIRNPFNPDEIVKTVRPRGRGVATSGTYARGQHIYNPHAPNKPILDIVSLTVIGPDVLEADRFATAAFAMGRAGIHFIEEMPGLEGYAVDKKGRATMTTGFESFVAS